MNRSRSIWLINGLDLIGGYGIDASPSIGAQDIVDERSPISHRRVAMEDLERGLSLYILRYAIADIGSAYHISVFKGGRAFRTILAIWWARPDGYSIFYFTLFQFRQQPFFLCFLCFPGISQNISHRHFAIGIAKGTGPLHITCIWPDGSDPITLWMISDKFSGPHLGRFQWFLAHFRYITKYKKIQRRPG